MNCSTTPIACVILAAIPVFSTVAMAPPAQPRSDNTAAQIKKLEERIATLERTVVRDPYRPSQTVVARLEAVERQLRDLDRSGQADARIVQRSLDELRREFTASRRLAQDLERRMSAVEQAQRSSGRDAALVTELRELRRDVDRLNRSVDDLRTRVSRLESRR